MIRHVATEIETRDGRCPVHTYVPDRDGSFPGVVVFMDGIGMRSAVLDVAARIAGAGYYAFLPDLFYRVGYKAEYGVNVFSDPVARADLMTRIMPSASPANVMRDMEAFFTYIDAQPEVRRGTLGITGYCMGGRLALYAAGYFAERFAAAASYHGGGLATDSPDSPHTLAPRMRARVYVAGAIEDRGFDEAQKARLEQALSDAGVDHTIETYPARHGWVLCDTPAHDQVAAERHWETLLALFARTLGGASRQ
ncbi:MAG TPA: dienelactone hydrolase family protein [Gemmatimonadaceae bacterium]|jgi:carboxymethylenebutenolidase|nr:dienelactone hydrolase family protein [Gemmatimonadaceae bacterium]